jgi:hypothetical protein
VKWIPSRRPSPALIVALLALFVSLSGVSYGVATGFIDSRENQIRTRDLRNNDVRGIDIRNSTVRGRDIALNTVTGEDVNEATLQKVPSALLADSATSSGSVAGVTLRRIAYSADEGSAKRTILEIGGLTLTAECKTGSQMELVANPAANQPNSHIATTGWTFEEVDFDPGDNVTATFGAEIRSGTIAFAGSGGSNVTINALAIEHANGIRGTTDDCGFFGTASAN